MGSYMFPESDWKLLCQTKDEALAEACEQACIIRGKSPIDSGACRPPIPMQNVQ
jgi:hypothetical protein